MIPFREPKWELFGGRFSRKIFRPPPDFLPAGGSGGTAAPPARFTSTGRQILTAGGGLGEAEAPPSEHRRQNSVEFPRKFRRGGYPFESPIGGTTERTNQRTDTQTDNLNEPTNRWPNGITFVRSTFTKKYFH